MATHLRPKLVKYLRHIVCTGGCGFIGSAFLRYMVPKYPQYFFINVDDMRAGSNEESLKSLQKAMNYIHLKEALEESKAASSVMDAFPVTDIIHFAAESDVDRSIKNPRKTIQANVMSTLHLLEAVKDQKQFKKFVYVSTDEVYGPVDIDDYPKMESDAQRPSSPYAASKAASESLVNAYHTTYGLNTVVTRGVNTFGPWQADTKLIPLAMKSLRERRKIPLYGEGEQIREWLPVERHVQAIEKLWKSGESGEIYNIGTGFRCTNLELVQILIDAVGAPKDAYMFVPDRPGHDFQYSISSNKLQQVEGKKSTEVVKKLIETARWYKSLSPD